MNDVAEKIRQLDPAKRALLEQMLANKSGPRSSAVDGIPTVARNAEHYALSSSQQRLWFLDQFGNAKGAFNLHAALRIHGHTDVETLHASVGALVQRHEVLRTTFVKVGSQPRQRVNASPRFGFSVHDLRGQAPAQREATVLELADAHARCHFDLATGPLLSISIARETDESNVLMLAMHHIVSDAWSTTLLLNEIMAHYEVISGDRAPLPELSIQYLDYAQWQQQRLRSESMDRHLEYWKQELSDAPDTLELPADYPRPETMTYAGAEVEFRVPADISKDLRALASSENATLFMVCLAAYATLLGRICNQDDVLIGTDIANRNRQEVEPLIGFFVNQLVMRCKPQLSLRIRELIAATRKTCLDAYGHQDVPFNHLVEALNVPRDPSRTPVYQAKFMLQNTRDADAGNTRMEAIPVAQDTSQFDLLLALKEDANGLLGSLRYRTDLFTDRTARSLVDMYQRCLVAFARAPERALCALDLGGSAAERETSFDYTEAFSDDGVLDRIERHAQIRPDQIATTSGEDSISYSQLVERYRALASWLGKKPGPRGPLAICLPRGIDMLVAILAALRSGIAYVPLDPEYGDDRLAYIVDDADCDQIIANDTPAWAGSRPVVSVEQGIQSGRAGSAAGIETWPTVHRHSIAYIIYTSGSTGRPKGVAVGHGALGNFIQAMDHSVGIANTDRMLAVTTLAFDIAVLELLLPLYSGAQVVIATSDEVRDGRRLLQRLRQSGSTIMQATPAGWRSLLHAAGNSPLGIRCLCGGEALDRTLGQELLNRCKSVLNLYGPTETTVWSSCLPVAHDDAQGTAVLSIGAAIANTSLHVLDTAGYEQMAGAVGQLAIGGHGLAQGYVGKPALTAQRFVPNPFSQTPGERMYLTGDLVRRGREGRLSFLGRNDFQVKLRGYRIELGEIEAVLRETQGVLEAAVALIEDAVTAGLVAFVVVDEPEHGNRERLKENLSDRLPGYMIPSRIVVLDAMPTTANGKLDRKALVTLDDRESAARTGSGTAPETQLERDIARCWATVLRVEKVVLEDDFFAFGGHSLLAIELLDAVSAQCDVTIGLQEFFADPSVRGLVHCVQSSQADTNQVRDSADDFPAIVPDPARASEPFPLTDIQQAYLVGRDGAFELGSIATQNYLEINVRNLDVTRFAKAWNALIERHGMLRTVFDEPGQQRTLSTVEPYEPRYEDLREQPAQERLLAIRRSMQSQVLPADTGPLFDLRITRLSDTRYRLHLCLDMLIADVSSAHILFSDLGRLYAQPENELPPLALSFRDYVVAEAELKRSDAWDKARRYWMDRVPHFPGAPELPLARDPADVRDQAFVRRDHHISRERWERLKARSSAYRISPTALLLTAFGEVLSRWSKSPRFALNLTLFNRLPLHPDVHEVVGDFTSSLLLEQDHRVAATFHERSRAVQDRLWSDLDHKLFSGVDLIRALSRARGGANAASMPVVFTSILGLDRGDGDEETLMSEHVHAFEDAEEGYSVSQTSQVWLDHQVAETNGGVTLVWDAIDALFPDGVLDAMFSTYVERLNALADSEDAWRTTALALPRNQLAGRVAANSVTRELQPCLLHEQFVRQAAHNPDAMAIIGDGIRLTYGSLDRLSNALARRLQDAGARPDCLVAVCMEKGVEQAIATLAVLKSGAAYMPVDAQLPIARRNRLFEQGETAIVLTQSRYAEELRQAQRTVIEVSAQGPEDADCPCTEISWSNLAYVIFTSGSTGTPKGVVIDHRGAWNTCLDVNERFGVDSSDCVLAISSLSFDLSVYDLFGVLGVGGTVVIPNADSLRDPAHWWECIESHAVTVWNTVPALMQLLVQHCESLAEPTLGSLKTVMMSGDWIPVGLPDRIRALGGEVQIISMGGATEASIWSIYHTVQTPTAHLRSIPYGKPLANQMFHVLDEQLQPCPDWVAGELYIGGIGVAREYWRDAARTSASFIDSERYGRIYRTGDMGRYMADGSIEFLGRNDDQVKIQGYRVELGEIEAALTAHDALQDAVVSAVGEAQQSKTLVAYVVPRSAPQGTDDEQMPELVADAERTQFKLAQHSVRELPADSARIRLAAPEVLGSTAGRQSTSGTCVGTLGHMLGGLRQTLLDGSPLPKYFYPSASSLYPVQTYVWLTEHEDTPSGFYYYSPRENALVRLAKSLPSGLPGGNRTQVYLIADMKAIAPMYSPARSQAFVEIEAGYIAELIASQGTVCGRAVNVHWSSEPTMLAEPILPPEAQLLGTLEWSDPGELAIREGGTGTVEYSVLRRQSVRQYEARAVSPDRMSQLVATVSPIAQSADMEVLACRRESESVCRWYRLTGDGGLHEIADKHESLEDAFAGDNVAVARGAWIALFMVHERQATQTRAAAGGCGQRLMAACARNETGFCPLGAPVSSHVLANTGLASGSDVIHALVGGHVSKDRWEVWDTQAPHASAPTQADLIEFLSERLPAYMVPRIYVPIDAIPLSSNGKVDRKALPNPQLEDKESSEQFVAPRTSEERAIARLWEKHLQVSDIGIHDNFFALGGNSLVAMQCIAQARIELNLEIGLRELFENPTISGILSCLGADGSSSASADLDLYSVRDQWKCSRGEDNDFPVSPAQQQLFSSQVLGDDTTAYSIPAALDICGALDVTALRQSLQVVVDRHEALRTCFCYVEGELRQRVLESVEVPFAVKDAAAGDTLRDDSWVQQVLDDEAGTPFDIERGPLVRCVVVRRDAETHAVLINVHHIVSDYLSMDIIVRELGQVYHALQQGIAPVLPALPLHYPDVVLWQRRFLDSAASEPQRKYWSSVLSGLTPLQLPGSDREVGEPDRWEKFQLDATTTRELRRAAGEGTYTPFMFGLAAVYALVHRATGQTDIAIGTPISLRINPDLENVVGLMLNTLLVRVDCDRGQDAEQLMEQIRKRVTSAFANRDLPFEEVERTHRQSQDWSDGPLYRVRYVYRRVSGRAAPDAGLIVTDREVARSEAKFDLLVSINEFDDGISGELEYRATAWPDASVRQMRDEIGPVVSWLAAQILHTGEAESLAQLNASLDQLVQHKQEQSRSLRRSRRRDALAGLRHER